MEESWVSIRPCFQLGNLPSNFQIQKGMTRYLNTLQNKQTVFFWRITISTGFQTSWNRDTLLKQRLVPPSRPIIFTETITGFCWFLLCCQRNVCYIKTFHS